MKYLGVIILALALGACARGDKGDSGSNGGAGPAGPTAPVTPESTVQQLVDANNLVRESLGQTYLTPGLSCTVQAISSGGFLSTSSPTYVAATCTANPLSAACAIVLTGPSYPYLLTVGFNQANSGPGPNSVLDPAIQALFETNNYRISCSGQIVITDNGYHAYSMSSDDGSILTIDGAQVINNDANHGIVTLNGTKNLTVGVHTFSILYAQSGGGNFALILDQDGSLLPAANLYH